MIATEITAVLFSLSLFRKNKIFCVCVYIDTPPLLGKSLFYTGRLRETLSTKPPTLLYPRPDGGHGFTFAPCRNDRTVYFNLSLSFLFLFIRCRMYVAVVVGVYMIMLYCTCTYIHDAITASLPAGSPAVRYCLLSPAYTAVVFPPVGGFALLDL